jgi:hypothetical protein
MENRTVSPRGGQSGLAREPFDSSFLYDAVVRASVVGMNVAAGSKPALLLSAPISALASCRHEYTRGYAYVVRAMSRGATEREGK